MLLYKIVNIIIDVSKLFPIPLCWLMNKVSTILANRENILLRKCSALRHRLCRHCYSCWSLLREPYNVIVQSLLLCHSSINSRTNYACPTNHYRHPKSSAPQRRRTKRKNRWRNILHPASMCPTPFFRLLSVY